MKVRRPLYVYLNTDENKHRKQIPHSKNIYFFVLWVISDGAHVGR